MSAISTFKKEVKTLERNMKLAINAVETLGFDEPLKEELIVSIKETIQLEIKNRVQVIIKESLEEAKQEKE